MVYSRQEVDQLLQRGQNRAIFDIEAEDVLYIRALVGGRLTAEKFQRLVVQVVYLVTVSNYDTIRERIEHACRLIWLAQARNKSGYLAVWELIVDQSSAADNEHEDESQEDCDIFGKYRARGIGEIQAA